MNPTYPIQYPQFYTATILEWKHLLLDNQHKEIIIDSLKFLVAEKRIILNAFVIMNNHIHLIWQPTFAFTLSNVQSSFMKHTAKQLKLSLSKKESASLERDKRFRHQRYSQPVI